MAGRRVAEQFFQHVNAAHDGRGVDAVGRGGQESALSNQAAAIAALERDPLERVALDALDAVMKGELTIEEGVVGIEEFARRQVLIEYVPEKHFRLGAHGGLEVVAIVLQKISRRRHGADVVEIQPAPHESAGRIGRTSDPPT